MRPTVRTLSTAALRLGMAVPIIYFGTQFAAAPFYPGYSFLRLDASTLGSGGSTFPLVFNSGAMLTGVAALVASWGFLCAFLRLRVNPALAWMASFAVLSAGLGSINAALFPMPDPRHASGALALAGSGIFLLPFVLPAAVWKSGAGKAEKIYFVANMIAILPVAIVMSGLVQKWSASSGVDLPNYRYFWNNCHGLLQRVFAAIALFPVGMAAGCLAKRAVSDGRTIS